MTTTTSAAAIFTTTTTTNNNKKKKKKKKKNSSSSSSSSSSSNDVDYDDYGLFPSENGRISKQNLKSWPYFKTNLSRPIVEVTTAS